MLGLKTKADLQQLVDEGLEESLTLDYKASPALTRDGKGPDELCKDVTALANSAGGQLVYGIEEDKVTKKPCRVDDGVADPKITREWIEQILNSRVQPRLSGLTTARVDMENGQYGYVISVPQSQTGPHQSPDQKYYRRFDLQSVPMYDYEIKDTMRRSTTPDLFLIMSFPSGNKAPVIFPADNNHSEAIQLEVDIGNNSNEPCLYSSVQIYIDTGLIISSAAGFSTGRHKRGPGVLLAKLERSLISPNVLPVFKGSRFTITSPAISFFIPWEQKGIPKTYFIRYQIMAPGFDVLRKGHIFYDGSTAELDVPLR